MNVKNIMRGIMYQVADLLNTPHNQCASCGELIPELEGILVPYAPKFIKTGPTSGKVDILRPICKTCQETTDIEPVDLNEWVYIDPYPQKESS